MNTKVRWGILHLLRQVARDNSADVGLAGMSTSSLQLLTQSLTSVGLLAVPLTGPPDGVVVGKQKQTSSYTVHLPPSSCSSRVFQVRGPLGLRLRFSQCHEDGKEKGGG